MEFMQSLLVLIIIVLGVFLYLQERIVDEQDKLISEYKTIHKDLSDKYINKGIELIEAQHEIKNDNLLIALLTDIIRNEEPE